MDEITINNVKFTNVPNKRTGLKMSNKLTQSNFSGTLAQYISSQDFYKLVSAIDIDWNGIEIDLNVTINDTADLINWIATTAGQAGADGVTPHIGANGNWFIGETDTGVSAQGSAGLNGSNGQDGKSAYQSYLDTTSDNPVLNESDWITSLHGLDGQNGTNGQDGAPGLNGITPHIDPTSKHWMIGETDTNIVAEGLNGINGQDGQDGSNGITPHIDPTTGNWFIGETDTEIHAQGPAGINGNDGVTPHINLTSGNWFIGDTDTSVPALGPSGQNGANGTNGITPHIGDNGNWFIGDTDTEVKAQGPKGDTGEQGLKGDTGTFDSSELADYATKQDISNLAEKGESYTKSESDTKYLTEHLDISGKANVEDLFSGSYNDLTDKPALFDGDYDSLSNKPTIPVIPTNVSSFTNDAGYLTSHQDISGKVNTTSVGAANGVASLDANGKVPSSQLPSYVDDVIEGYYHEDNFYATFIPGEDPDTYSDLITPESDKIYVDKTTNKTYRWSGTTYVEISPSVVVGTNTGNAADGKVVDDHIKDTTSHITSAERTAWNAKVDTSLIGSLGNASEAVAATYYTAEEAAEYNSQNELQEGDEGYKSEGDEKTPAVPAVPNTVKSYIDNVALGGIRIVKITETAYTNLVTKDPNTLYVVTEDE